MTDGEEAIEFFVPGESRPAGSKVSGVAHRKTKDGTYEPVRNEATGKLKTFTKDSSGAAGTAWRADVRAAAVLAMGGRMPLEGAVAVDLRFAMRRPPTVHYGSGRNANVLKPSAPAFWHTKAPDIDKLSRSILDALKGVVWDDDGQVALKTTQKFWADRHLGEPYGAYIRIEPLFSPRSPSPAAGQAALY